MDIRNATVEDADEIRSVARSSLEASYGHVLSSDLLDDAVERWYAADEVAEDLEDEDTVFVVAVDGGRVIGFAQSYVVERRETVGEIDWLHVDPDNRGGGIGDQLLRRVEAALRDHGVERIEGRVLSQNEAGGEFYEQEGFSAVGDRTVAIGGEPFTERLYAKFLEDADRQVLAEARTTADGDPVYVAYDESERASLAPLYVTYEDREQSRRYGYFCGNCESLVTAMDAMGRVECGNCGNRRKPTRWDAAYL